jgi:hypothetical protein
MLLTETAVSWNVWLRGADWLEYASMCQSLQPASNNLTAETTMDRIAERVCYPV